MRLIFDKKYRLLILILIILIFLIKRFILKLNYSLAFFSGWTEDAYLWIHYALYLDNKTSLLLSNFYFTSSLGNIPAYVQGKLAPLFTLTILSFLKLFGSIKYYIYIIPILQILLISVFFKISEELKLSDDEELMALFSFIVSPYFLTLSYKIRPDNWAFLFASLAFYFALKNRYIITSFLYSISVFGYKIQFIYWFFILVYLLKSWKARIIFTTVFSFFGLIYFILIYLPINKNYPTLLEYLAMYNSQSLQFNFRYLLILTKIIGLLGLGTLAIMYLLNPINIFYLIKYHKISELFGSRSFHPQLITDLGFSHIWRFAKSSIFPFLKYIFILIIIVQALANSYYFYVDIKNTIIENKFYKKLEELSRNPQNTVCSYRRESNFFLRLYFPKRTNLGQFFSRTLEIRPDEKINCSIITYSEEKGFKTLKMIVTPTDTFIFTW